MNPRFWLLAGLAALVGAHLPLAPAAEGNESEKATVEGAGTEWIDELTTVPPGDFPMLDPCTMRFNVSWNGVLKAGEADVDFRVSGEGDYQGALETYGEAKSTGVARVLWPYDASIRSLVDADSLRPLYLEQEEEDRSERNQYETRFIGDFIFSKRVTTPNEGEKVTKEKVYESSPRMHDLISAVLYVRSFELDENGKTFRLATFPFDSRYLVELTQTGREKFKFQGDKIDAIKFDVEIRRILKSGELKSYEDKFQKATVWISDDELRLPLELRAEIFVGSVRATLVDHLPTGDDPAEEVSPADKEDVETPASDGQDSNSGAERKGFFPRAGSRGSA